MWQFVKYDISILQTLFTKVETSDFLAGRTKDWQANFDWIMKEDRAVAILEGQYDNRGKQNRITDMLQSQGVQDFLSSEER